MNGYWFLDMDHGRLTLLETGTVEDPRYLLGLSVMADFVDAEARCELSRRELCRVVTWLEDATAGGTAVPLAEVLRTLRLSRNLSQSRLAELVDVEHSTVSRWEAGDRVPSRDAMLRIMRVLEVTKDEWRRLASAYLDVTVQETDDD